MTLPFYATNRNIFGIRFKLECIYQIIGKPLSLFQDQFVNIDDVYARHKELKDIFDQHPLIQQKIAALNKYFIGLSPNIRQGSDAKLTNYLKKLEQGHSWKDISQEIGRSQQYIRRVFAKHVGISPKKIEKIWRFNRIKASISKLPSPDLAELALANGYYDQAHFNHDFKELSGLSPSDWST
jgi:AraC-like DNA-binding protein